MRSFVILLIIAALGFVYLREKQSEPAVNLAKPVATQSAGATPAPLTPAPRGQASEYNYMKRALDRAHDVRDQSRAQTQEAQNP